MKANEMRDVTARIKGHLSALNAELLHLGQILANDDDENGCAGIIFCTEQIDKVKKLLRGHHNDALYKLREKGAKMGNDGQL